MQTDGNPMHPLSAVEAIAPAFTRVNQILFRPFRVGRSWKLASCGYLAFLGSVFIPFPLFMLPLLHRPELAGVRTGLLLFVSAMVLLYFVLFLFGVGLGLVQFDMIVTRGRFVAPMWRRVSARVWPWIGVKVVVGTVLSLLMAPLGFAAVHALERAMSVMPRTTPGQMPDPASYHLFWVAMLSYYGLALGFCFVLKTASTLLDDFARPYYLLEPITLREAFRCGVRVCVAEPGEVVLYLAMKLVLGVAGFIMQYVSYFVVALGLLVVGGVGGLLGYLIIHPLGQGSPAGKLLLLVGAGLLYVLFVVAICWYGLGSLGYLMTLLEAYGVYFLAGRYPLLARLMEPGPGTPFTPPPAIPTRNDGPAGPPFPMDPVVA